MPNQTSKSWRCNCPEYNYHSIGAIEQCKRCGKKEPKAGDLMSRLAPEFLSLLEQYAADPGLLEGLEGACVAIVEREVKAALAEKTKQSFSQQLIDQSAEERNLDDPHFDGVAVEKEKDQERLTGGLFRVFDFMMDQKPHTIEEISKGAQVPENSASAHFRALRKKRWGAHVVLRTRLTDSGLFAYRLVPNKESLTYLHWTTASF